jgi:hypothetical protein
MHKPRKLKLGILTQPSQQPSPDSPNAPTFRLSVNVYLCLTKVWSSFEA